MKIIYGTRNLVVAGIFLLLVNCTFIAKSETPTVNWAEQDFASFPYHPLVYHLDLNILAYQLYSQSLVWPFDPYYEAMDSHRDEFMHRVHNWAKKKGGDTLNKNVLNGYRGPGALGGFDNNVRHDPIIYNYGLLHPWSHSLTNLDGRWVEYKTPKEITAQIKDVYVSYRNFAKPENSVSLVKLEPAGNKRAADANDMLIAFEGGTGDKGEKGEPASQSLMGFVLTRMKPNGHYDVHIVFRGSRAGSGARAMLQAFRDKGASGNPDWITDMGYNRVAAGRGAEHITSISAVSRGFSTSMRSILPQVFASLKKVADAQKGRVPDNIYVTGHSLGGALAQHFVSAILLGEWYGPGGSGKSMPTTLKIWPWKNIKLITYGAPRAGDKLWAKTLTESALESDFFTSTFNPLDTNAWSADDPRIVSRLLNTNRPAAYRVLISGDPLTSEKVGGGGKHVGKTVYANTPSIWDILSPPDIESHEPKNVREFIVDSLSDARTPKNVWRYRTMQEMVPDYNEQDRGSAVDMKRLSDAIKNYYSKHKIWFDSAAFEKHIELRLMLNQRGRRD